MSIWNKIRPDEIKLILSKRYTSNELSNILTRNVGTITKIARENNITLPIKPIRKYILNENIFTIWTSEIAYIIGFIMADGCILNSKNGTPSIISIGLAKKDKLHLENIRNVICKEIPVRDKLKTNSCILNICSKKMAIDLVKLGITPNKSLTLKWPSNIPHKYIPDVIRGYFDGDGYVRVKIEKKYKYKILEFSMLGTENVLLHIKELFSKYYKKNVGCIESCYKWYKSYRLTFSSKSARIFGEWIYNSGELKLERKYKIYYEYISSIS